MSDKQGSSSPHSDFQKRPSEPYLDISHGLLNLLEFNSRQGFELIWLLWGVLARAVNDTDSGMIWYERVSRGGG